MEKVINLKLNFLKGIACMGVVFIHVTFPGMFGSALASSFGWAVPVFCMIAGYYAYGKGVGVVKGRLIKIVRIFVYAYLVHMAYGVIKSIFNNNLEAWVSMYFNWKTPIKYIFFCMVDFAPLLWYLIAMIETYIMWYIIVKKQKEELWLKVIPLLFFLQILLNGVCKVTGLGWTKSTIFITQAMPWFLLGYCLHTDKLKKIREMTYCKLLIVTLLGLLCVVIANVCTILALDWFGYIPFATGLFCLCLKSPSNSICGLIEYIGERISLNIYILHNIVAGILTSVARTVLGINMENNNWLWCKPIWVLIVTIFTSWILYIVTNRIKARIREKGCNYV